MPAHRTYVVRGRVLSFDTPAFRQALVRWADEQGMSRNSARTLLADRICAAPGTVRSWYTGSYVPADVRQAMLMAACMGLPLDAFLRGEEP